MAKINIKIEGIPGKRGYGNHNIISQGGCRKKNIC